ncbi:hypothetical protein [Pseudomonas lactis]|uniref:hypothetical protein n=1 Tax=Pseudomonas lactis TaxID=1615674 RepID=UPI00110C838C|nr:hypothetical protein [Pseudomonas lactis]
MTELNQNDLSAAISEIEKRMESRADRVERESDRRADAYRKEQEARDLLYAERFEAMSRRLEDRDKLIDSKLDGIAGKISGIDLKVDGFESKIDAAVVQVRKSNRATLGGMLTIGIAIVLGVWGVNSTIISSASGIFSAGQDSQKSQQANENILRDTQDLLQQLKQSQSPPKADK